MIFEELSIKGIILIKPTIFEDSRGSFIESYHIDKFNAGGIEDKFVQDNFVISNQNILRGMHYQEKFPQAKLVRCLRGRIFDVAIDVRTKSSTFGKWIGVELSEINNYQLYIPEGFAHGYYVMSEIAQVYYKCSNIYYPEYEKGIIWNDPNIKIIWPAENPCLSQKDKAFSSLESFEVK